MIAKSNAYLARPQHVGTKDEPMSGESAETIELSQLGNIVV
jgi:hypothetical protein